MSFARITINGYVEWEGDTCNTEARTPEFIASLIKPKSSALATLPEFHMLALSAAFAQASLTQKDTLIDVRKESTWWSITVKER